MPVLQQNNQISKEIGVNISIFVGSSVLNRHIVKQVPFLLHLQPLIFYENVF